MSAYTFLDHWGVSEELARRLADRLVLRDERSGALVMRLRTEEHVTLRPATVVEKRAA